MESGSTLACREKGLGMVVPSENGLYRNSDLMLVLSAMFAHGQPERAFEIGSWLVPPGVPDAESWARQRLEVLEREGFVSSSAKGDQRYWFLTPGGNCAIKSKVSVRPDHKSLRSRNGRKLIEFRFPFRELEWFF